MSTNKISRSMYRRITSKPRGMEEHKMQCAFMDYCKMNPENYAGLDLIFAIPNGGQRNKIVAGRFEVEPSYWSENFIIFQIVNDHYHCQNGSHLPPEIKKLLEWMPLPEGE